MKNDARTNCLSRAIIPVAAAVLPRCPPRACQSIRAPGVNFMEKTITLRNTEITFSIWDLGGQREFLSMLPLVCNDAVAIFFMFDLSRKSTLNSVKEWYRQVRYMIKREQPTDGTDDQFTEGHAVWGGEIAPP
ncbi:unnamed protein product [Ectocarpus sp. CCAP 1310/34]|nr:unnamed protein product [Ectocarpus sp. CCAP 1310/34]